MAVLCSSIFFLSVTSQQGRKKGRRIIKDLHSITVFGPLSFLFPSSQEDGEILCGVASWFAWDGQGD